MKIENRQTDAPGHDSFLDVVANMVGILIILVMVVGVRVKNAPVVTSISGKTKQVDRELEEDLNTERSLREGVLSAAGQTRTLQRETLVQRRRRDILATAVAACEHRIRSRKQQMDTQTQTDFDLKRSLLESRFQLQQLGRRRAQAENAPAEPILVESYPTPLSRTVDGNEAHFQLRGGQVARVPLSELLEKLKVEIRQKKYKLRNQAELTGTIGPLDGFRLKYTFRRHDISPELAMEIGYSGSIVRLERATFIPVSGRLGEPVETALADGSEFRLALSKLRPGRTTITLWTYPDSFAAFRRIKKELYQRGFAAAARPLPHGTPISGSPEGTKSAAE